MKSDRCPTCGSETKDETGYEYYSEIGSCFDPWHGQQTDEDWKEAHDELYRCHKERVEELGEELFKSREELKEAVELLDEAAFFVSLHQIENGEPNEQVIALKERIDAYLLTRQEENNG